MNELHDQAHDKTSWMSKCKHANGKAPSRGAFLPQLHDRIERIVRSASDAEDVIQDAMLAACRVRPREWWHQEGGQLHRWLTVAARRLAINWLRRRRRDAVQSLDALKADPKDRREEEAANLTRREEECALLRIWVEELREKEPDNYRLLDGHYFKDCRVADLAEELGLSPNAASQRLARLRDRLRAQLARHRRDAGAP